VTIVKSHERGPPRRLDPYATLTAEEITEAAMMFLDSVDTADIAQELGVMEATIWNAMERIKAEAWT
jgi:DNA-directed RNA polymerase specialized sigma24 family protein